ncbi:nucleotidyltransferase domain-containing protein [Paenibacillus xerothermodurans]|uniref:Nucleotidyltransferase domain-containing protein n=2 Tax=Paenibacillus xerothermodurans TaxID=1977292 RepID=A0A2W1P5G8_PAEXE|nr:nucleotidyltransferase domain-containing protein [Paenibacillus xerothermodurans]PZE22892.1 nucleotidyltransferase domain-containing protein [Paenibacillus xerothermodurans]
METLILQRLEEVEAGHHVKILFAVESGSRAWGVASEHSDYDVRFVYIHPPEWYLSIDDKRDVIEVPIDGLLDMYGWDIRKALKLFRKSNPPLLEWLESGIIYHDNHGFRAEMLALKPDIFSPKACMHHYLSMAKRNFDSLRHGEQANLKKYFNVLRPLLSCLWIQKQHVSPPIVFEVLVDHLLPSSSDVRREVYELINSKKSGVETELNSRNDAIHAFVTEQLVELTEYANSVAVEQQDHTDELDRLYRKHLVLAWGKEV